MAPARQLRCEVDDVLLRAADRWVGMRVDEQDFQRIPLLTRRVRVASSTRQCPPLRATYRERLSGSP
jgi:hypothetical protein